MRSFARDRKSLVFFFVFLAIAGFSASLAAGASEGSKGGGVTVMPDWSVGIQIINFLLILWILNLILYRPIRNILRQRKEKIERLELSIATYNEDAKEKEEAFASGIKEARAKGLKEKEALLQAGAEEEKKLSTGYMKRPRRSYPRCVKKSPEKLKASRLRCMKKWMNLPKIFAKNF